MPQPRTLRFLFLMAAAPVGGAAFAQASPAAPKSFCFRAQPLAACRTFAVFEFTGALRLAGTSHPDPYSGTEKDLGEWVAWDVGMMKNRDSTHAIGGSLAIGGSGGGTRIALKARRRTWLTKSLTFDVSGGPLAAQQQASDLSGTKNGWGVTGEAAIGALDLVGLTIGADAIHVQDRNAAALYVGGKVGSHAAVGATVLAGIGLYLLVRALSHGWD